MERLRQVAPQKEDLKMNKSYKPSIVRLTEIEDRCKSNSHRIDRLEQSSEALNRLASSVEVLATEQKNMYEKINSIDTKVTDLEKVPSSRWNSVIGYVIASLISAFITLILTK